MEPKPNGNGTYFVRLPYLENGEEQYIVSDSGMDLETAIEIAEQVGGVVIKEVIQIIANGGENEA